MDKVADIKLLFLNQVSPGIYRHDLKTPLDEFLLWANRTDFRIFYVDGTDIADERTLVRRFIEASGYAPPYGENLDAFEELMRDLDWIRGKGYVLLRDEE